MKRAVRIPDSLYVRREDGNCSFRLMSVLVSMTQECKGTYGSVNPLSVPEMKLFWDAEVRKRPYSDLALGRDSIHTGARCDMRVFFSRDEQST